MRLQANPLPDSGVGTSPARSLVSLCSGMHTLKFGCLGSLVKYQLPYSMLGSGGCSICNQCIGVKSEASFAMPKVAKIRIATHEESVVGKLPEIRLTATTSPVVLGVDSVSCILSVRISDIITPTMLGHKILDHPWPERCKMSVLYIIDNKQCTSFSVFWITI